MPKSKTKSNVSAVVTAFSSLDETSKRMALAQLKKLMPSDDQSVGKFVENLRDKRFRKGFACPHCNSEKVIRHGMRNGCQRYRCNSCSKTYSDHTHTPFRGTRYPKKWLPFMEHMVNGLSIRKFAKILCIADSTVFQWRHKILTALKRMELDDFEGLDIKNTKFVLP